MPNCGEINYFPQINILVDLRCLRSLTRLWNCGEYLICNYWCMYTAYTRDHFLDQEYGRSFNAAFHACILILRSLTRLWNCGEYLICNYWCMYTAYTGDQFLDQECGRSFNAAFSNYELSLRSWAWLWNCGELRYNYKMTLCQYTVHY